MFKGLPLSFERVIAFGSFTRCLKHGSWKAKREVHGKICKKNNNYEKRFLTHEEVLAWYKYSTILS